MRINPITSQFNIKKQQNAHNQTQVIPVSDVAQKKDLN